MRVAEDESNAELYLKNYTLGSTLGSGAFSKVASQLKDFVLPLLLVKREIEIISHLSHPHIAKLYEVIETSRCIYLVSELASNGTLFEYIVKNGRLTEQEGRRHFQQVLVGVEYCHKKRIVHRDLKPENLVLDQNNDVKIIDFGLSNIMRDGSFLKTTCGSPNYAAPEIIKGQWYAGPEVDVWSCGVILYALVCGRLPFDGENQAEVVSSVVKGLYVMPHYVSSGARDLIRRMLMADPTKRITIPEIKNHPWFLANLPKRLATIQANSSLDEIDERVADMVASQGYDRRKLVECLKNKVRTEATVIYSLLYDQQRQLRRRGYLGGELGEPSASQLREVLGLDNAGCQQLCHHNSRVVAAKRWNLGISVQGQPKEIMTNLFSVLNCRGVLWKKVGPYCFRCRKVLQPGKCQLSEAGSPPTENGHVIKFEVQLYRIDKEDYFIDCQRACGNVYAVTEFCGSFLTELQSQVAAF